MNIYSSETGASEPNYQERSVTQNERGDIYIKVFFSILHHPYNTPVSEDSREYNVAEGLVLRDIVGSSEEIIDVSEKIHETIIIDCSDLIVSDEGVCDDSEGLYMKILEALYDLSDIVERNRLRIPHANVHIAVYGFEMIEDAVRGFVYLVDDDNSLNLTDDKLCSYILALPPFFEDVKEWGWFMWTEYVGVFEYYQLYQVLEGHVEKKQQQTASSPNNGTGVLQEEPTRTFELYVSENVFVAEYDNQGNWLDTVQLVFDVVGFVPLVGEFASLANGLIYLGREIHAGITGDDDKMNEYKWKAVVSFAGAIPGSSVLKGTIRFIKAGRATRNMQHAQTIANMASRDSRKCKQALNRVRNSKISRRKKSEAKRRNPDVQRARNAANRDLEKAIEIRNTRLREGGWTIQELTNTSMGKIRRGYKNIRNTANKIFKRDPGIPTTTYDNTIDKGEFILKYLLFENGNSQPTY